MIIYSVILVKWPEAAMNRIAFLLTCLIVSLSLASSHNTFKTANKAIEFENSEGKLSPVPYLRSQLSQIFSIAVKHTTDSKDVHLRKISSPLPKICNLLCVRGYHCQNGGCVPNARAESPKTTTSFKSCTLFCIEGYTCVNGECRPEQQKILVQ